MRRLLAVLMTLALALALSGCGQKAEQAANPNSADSLLASNPVEPAQGNLTPQEQYQEPAQSEPPAPPPASKPASKPAAKPAAKPSAPETPAKTGVTIPAGTGIKVAVNAKISSETAQAGDPWSGTVQAPVIIGDRVAIPQGAHVNGVVAGVEGAQKGSRAFLLLAVKSVEMDGQTFSVGAGTDSIIAGSTRARNLGAIAGGAAAGALIGKAVGGSNKGALIGGLIGGAAAGAGVAASKGYQVVIQEGTEITFNTREAERINK